MDCAVDGFKQLLGVLRFFDDGKDLQAQCFLGRLKRTFIAMENDLDMWRGLDDLFKQIQGLLRFIALSHDQQNRRVESQRIQSFLRVTNRGHSKALLLEQQAGGLTTCHILIQNQHVLGCCLGHCVGHALDSLIIWSNPPGNTSGP